ncbi:MAG: DNA mismatch repair endonuclease MutL [Rubritalea sp.]|uniref:DNA mismatch repair endonuclease MutL n=1 Tax=Rubritalea sp. TaxID=2109375 RepID=UPI003242ED4A
MPKIAILPDVLASQVAAGEVVERPASVVKEMVENSIDAGAKSIEVEIQKGGASLIKITDDGSGMGKEDALMCLERHATSKLKNAKQLSAITTMGFRGEAVPSIASVSKFRLATREHESVEGTEIIVDGGIVQDVKVAGLQPGTIFEIRQLFFNIPARRKFMRAESTESAHVEHQVKLHALAWPSVRFTMRKDGRTVFDLPATNDKRMRISGIAGTDAGKALIEVPACEESDMEVHGYVLPAEFARKGRRQQFVFLNGRPIEDPAISRALKDAFKGAVSDGLNPSAWLWIEMDPKLVDVNVHPAKKEVRFHKPFEVRHLVLTAVEAALVAKSESASSLRGEPKIISRKDGSSSPLRKPFEKTSEPEVHPPVHSREPVSAASPQSILHVSPTEADVKAKFAVKAKAEQKELEIEADVKDSPQFSILGVLHDRYILLQGDDGLVVMDPKAARERMVYESLLDDEAGGLESQGLLVPELVDLDPRDFDVVMTNLENFTEAGISLEPFGGGTIQVRSMPAVLGDKDPRAFISALIDELVETVGGKRAKSMAFQVFAEKLAKRAACNEVAKRNGNEQFLGALFQCDLPYCAPDGRPTVIHLSLKELERKFS